MRAFRYYVRAFGQHELEFYLFLLYSWPLLLCHFVQVRLSADAVGASDSKRRSRTCSDAQRRFGRMSDAAMSAADHSAHARSATLRSKLTPTVPFVAFGVSFFGLLLLCGSGRHGLHGARRLRGPHRGRHRAVVRDRAGLRGSGPAADLRRRPRLHHHGSAAHCVSDCLWSAPPISAFVRVDKARPPTHS